MILAAQSPPKYLEFLQPLNEAVYDLLSINESTISYSMYKDCDINDLLDLIGLATSSDTSQVCGLHVRFYCHAPSCLSVEFEHGKNCYSRMGKYVFYIKNLYYLFYE